jgi:hypothetical protein
MSAPEGEKITSAPAVDAVENSQAETCLTARPPEISHRHSRLSAGNSTKAAATGHPVES